VRVLLFRHGPAGERRAWAAKGKPDAERPLTKKGVEKTRQAARGLCRLAPRLERIAASPLVRAEQTADALAEAYPKTARVSLDELAPDGDRDRLLSWLRAQPASSRLALVGHEPSLSRAAAWLLTGRDEPIFELRKAGACLLEFPRAPSPGGARLLWLAKPSQLRLVGR
jgi:phosphohistidine phosphatase